MKGKEKNYQKGITLIAIVITIVVLLILAGVTLSIVFNGGIIDKSQQAADTYSEESAKEKLSLALFNYKMGVITGEVGEGKKDLSDYLAEIGGTITIETSDSYTVEVEGYEFIVGNKNYEITSNGPVTGEKPEIQGVTFDLVGEEKLSAIIKVTASATKGGALRVIIGGKEATLENGTYNLTVTKNGIYTILVEESELKRKAIGTVEVSGIEKVKYTVTINKGTGIESVTASTQVEDGNTLNIEAIVQSGYAFSKWNVTSGNASAVASLTSATTIVKPTENITIEATAVEKAVLNNINGSANAKVGSGDFAYNNPVVPVGFRTSDEGASWEDENNDGIVDGWNEGLVIQDESGNQFVWVPVDGTNVRYTKWCTTGMSYKDSSIKGDVLPSGVTEITQINTYGGFYIGRYEASKPSSGTVPQTKYNKAPWINIDYGSTNSYAKLYKNNENVKSGLLTGKMWDTALAWINTGVSGYATSTSYGNYSGTKKNTGITTKDCVKNIYDLAGNVREWTCEKNVNGYMVRGGFYNTSSSAAYRWTGFTGTTYNFIRF